MSFDKFAVTQILKRKYLYLFLFLILALIIYMVQLQINKPKEIFTLAIKNNVEFETMQRNYKHKK